MGRIAGNNDDIAPVVFETLGAVIKRKRRVDSARQERRRAIGSLRILLHNKLGEVLVGFGRRCFHDLVVQVNGCRRSEPPDHADLKAL